MKTDIYNILRIHYQNVHSTKNISYSAAILKPLSNVNAELIYQGKLICFGFKVIFHNNLKMISM